MGKSKLTKIDLNREYPCPCGRKGKLLPIILTEAMGCDRCQNIFVLTENGQFIEEVSSTYPYKKAWYWTGKNWTSNYKNWQRTETYLTLSIVVFALIWLPLIFGLSNNGNITFLMIIGVLAAILPAILAWLAYRR